MSVGRYKAAARGGLTLGSSRAPYTSPEEKAVAGVSAPMTSPLLGDGTGGERERGRERRESAIEIEKKRDGVRERATARERNQSGAPRERQDRPSAERLNDVWVRSRSASDRLY